MLQYKHYIEWESGGRIKAMEQAKLLDLVQKSQSGDRQAWEELIRAVQDRVYYRCRRILGNETDALDATQDVLVAMLESIVSLRQPEAFPAWLNRMTVNICCKQMSRISRERRIQQLVGRLLPDEEAAEGQRSPDKELDNEENRRIIVELVDALPAEQRACVLLYYYDEMPVKDVAQLLHLSEGTVKSRLHYARRRIKRGVERYTRQGLQLYGLSPIPFLRYFLRQEAACGGLAGAAAERMIPAVLAAAAAGTGAAVGTVGTFLSFLTGKAAVAGLLAAGAIAGGVVLWQSPAASEAPAPPPREQVSVPSEPSKKVSVSRIPLELPKPGEEPAPAEPAPAKPSSAPAPLAVVPQPPQEAEPVLPPFPYRPVVMPPAAPGEEPEEEKPAPVFEWQTGEAPLPEPEPEPPSRPGRTEDWFIVPQDPVLPTPRPEPEPEPEPDPEPAIRNKPLVDYGYNGGYGYTSSFLAKWQEPMSDQTIVYSSSDPSVVCIDEEGNFTTLAPGTAVLTAADPAVSDDVLYTMTVEVADRLNWEYSLPNVACRVGYSDVHTFQQQHFSWPEGFEGYRIQASSWSSSDPAVAEAGVSENPAGCRLNALSAGTAEITGVITFQVDTVAGWKTMEDTVSFLVTVTEPLPELPDPEPPDPEDPPGVINKDVTQYGVNGGYGYSSTFAEEWEWRQPEIQVALPEHLTFTSSAPDIVAVNDQGELTTLAPGTAVLTAADPDAPDRQYTLTFQVQDRFQWEYGAPDKNWPVGSNGVYQLERIGGINGTCRKPVSTRWSSSDESVAVIDSETFALWNQCRLVGVAPGTAEITGVVTFKVDTPFGEKTMTDTVVFRVTVIDYA